jgi:Mrp family chromosome partitioning ATPase
MVSNYKILRKANLTDDLFVSEIDEAALLQEEADRDWASGQERDVVGEMAFAAPAALPQGEPDEPEAGAEPRAAAETKLEAPPAAEPEVELEAEPEPEIEIEPAAEPEAQDRQPAAPPELVFEPVPAPTPAPTRALVKVSRERGWTQVLADLTGDDRLEGIRCLGVCPLDAAAGSAAAAALARWVSQHSGRPALVVEAHFGASRQGARFNAADTGVSDILLRGKGLEEAIQETSDENLLLLASGEPAGLFRRHKLISGFPALLLSLRQRYETIVVELPAADDPLLKKLPLGSITDAVILAADPKSAPPKKLKRAAAQLEELGAPPAATMLSSTQSVSSALRRERLAQQVEARGFLIYE